MACSDRYTEEYTEENLRVLSGVEHIRLRPGMYVGSQDSRGLLYMISAILSEALAGSASTVGVALDRDRSIQIADNRIGPLTPSGSPEAAINGILSPGLGSHAWEIQIASALSKWFWIELRHDGQRYRQEFQRGEPVAPASKIGSTQDTGLTIAFRPDPEIFGDSQFSPNLIRDRLRELSFLNPGVRFSFSDSSTGTVEVYDHPGGVADFVRWLNVGEAPLHAEICRIHGDESGVEYDVAIQWSESEETIVRCFVNNRLAWNGGTPVTGLYTGITRPMNEYIRETFPDASPLKGESTRVGLTCVIALRMANPVFVSATHSQLGNPEVEGMIATAVRAHLKCYFREHPDVAERIVQQARLDEEVAQLAREAGANLKRQNRANPDHPSNSQT